jgi:hypothetical protein
MTNLSSIIFENRTFLNTLLECTEKIYIKCKLPICVGGFIKRFPQSKTGIVEKEMNLTRTEFCRLLYHRAHAFLLRYIGFDSQPFSWIYCITPQAFGCTPGFGKCPVPS